jgi:F-type H+-transporting ATPase subunit a
MCIDVVHLKLIMSGNPLAQFQIKKLFSLPEIFGYNIDFTNSSLFMVFAVLISVLFLYFGCKKLEVKPTSRLQIFIETIYDFIDNMMSNSIKDPEAKRFFPFIFTLFMFIISCNLLGMLPYGFTVTSHLSITFGIALAILVFITIYGLVRNGFSFLGIFFPSGTPLWLMPLVTTIEVFAYCARAISLSLRLGANMIAGHTMLKVIAGLCLGAGVFSILPFTFVVAITAFEFFVAVLQAYIFSMLVCVYLNDVYSTH